MTWILGTLDISGLSQWTEKLQQAINDLYCKSANIFSKTDMYLGKCNALKHDIKLTDY